MIGQMAMSAALRDEIKELRAENKALKEAAAPFAAIKPSSFFAADRSECEPYAVVLLRDCESAADQAFTGKDLVRLRALVDANKASPEAA